MARKAVHKLNSMYDTLALWCVLDDGDGLGLQAAVPADVVMAA